MSKKLAWIRYAINFETKFLTFYNKCYRESKDNALKDVFKFLMTQESAHKKILNEVLTWSSEGDNEMLNKSILEFTGLKVKEPTFSDEGVRELSSSKSSISKILNQAMEFEEQGMEFYLELAKKEKNGDIRLFLTRLANDERQHKEIIKNVGASFLDINML
jgi:rubrerythrin